jgi:hypothetical protein
MTDYWEVEPYIQVSRNRKFGYQELLANFDIPFGQFDSKPSGQISREQ